MSGLLKEAVRLEQMLPLWAQSGPTVVDRYGKTEGFSNYPMLSDEMPTDFSGPSGRILRCDEKHLAECLVDGRISHKLYSQKRDELAARILAQRDEKRKIGLDLIEDEIESLDGQLREYSDLRPDITGLYTKWKGMYPMSGAREEAEEAILTLEGNDDGELRMQIEVLRSIAESEPSRLVGAVKLLARSLEEDLEEEAAA
jgi:hypothetical protein